MPETAYRDAFPHWADDFDRLIPQHMRGAVERYILYGIPPGGFLCAVVSGDLNGAIMRADHVNKSNLENYCHFFHWAAPSECHKDAESLAAWIDQGGVIGKHESEGTEPGVAAASVAVPASPFFGPIDVVATP